MAANITSRRTRGRPAGTLPSGHETVFRPNAGSYIYKEVSLARQQRGEVICSHCNDVASRRQLRTHMDNWWDDDKDEWMSVRDTGKYETPLPRKVADQYKPYVILGGHYHISDTTAHYCWRNIGLMRDKHGAWVTRDSSHDYHDRRTVPNDHRGPVDDMSLSERYAN